MVLVLSPPLFAPVIRFLANLMPIGEQQTRLTHNRRFLFKQIREWITEARAAESESDADGKAAAAAGPDGAGSAEGSGDRLQGGTEGAAITSAPAPASTSTTSSIPQPGSFLISMLGQKDRATGKDLTDDQIAGQVFTMILAGCVGERESIIHA